MRLDVALVEQGWTRSRNRSATLIKDGNVYVNGTQTRKASYPVTPQDQITVTGTASHQYASRASYKLLRTIEAIHDELELQGVKALDIGASTGGFTDVLLKQGAEHVIALDVGHDQIVPELRTDPRVTVIENFNARELTPQDLEYVPELIVCDVSFISIKLLFPALHTIVSPETNLLLMVKPQFEVGKDMVGSGGVVRNPEHHAAAILGVADSAAEHGFGIIAVIPSSLPGPNGNREFFVWLRPQEALLPREGENYVEVVQRAVDHATQVSEVSDMIDTHAYLPVVKGMPNQETVPNTTVYWV